MNMQIEAFIRRETESFLTDECTIQRKQSTINAAGQQVGGWQEIDIVKMRLLPMSQRDQQGMVAMRETNRAHYRLMMPVGTDVRNGDRVRIDSKIYEVLEIFARTTDKVFIEARVSELAQ